MKGKEKEKGKVKEKGKKGMGEKEDREGEERNEEKWVER